MCFGIVGIGFQSVPQFGFPAREIGGRIGFLCRRCIGGMTRR